MRKYRIKMRDDGLYYPQMKGWFFWHGWQEVTKFMLGEVARVDLSFPRLVDAEAFLAKEHGKELAQLAHKQLACDIEWKP